VACRIPWNEIIITGNNLTAVGMTSWIVGVAGSGTALLAFHKLLRVHTLAEESNAPTVESDRFMRRNAVYKFTPMPELAKRKLGHCLHTYWRCWIYLTTLSLSHTSTNSIELGPSSEAISGSAADEFPNILRNSKVYYRIHKSRQMVPNLSQINPVHITPHYPSKLNFNIIHPSKSWSS
jgi:hypothetical protein